MWEVGNGQGKMEGACHVEHKATARKGLCSSSDLKL